jgi:poly(ADP-ribose) glycohydrolase ARH3
MGDVIGAAVEAESPGYIRRTFRNLDEILALKSVPELFSGEWEVGRFTDDTQMTISVAEWLASGARLDGKALLERFWRAYEPWRHYGPGVRLILESYPNARERWMELATAMFPQGSYGNGSAMRVGPIGLFLHNDLAAVIDVVRTSSIVTHSHYLAVQGAVLQATAVALAVSGNVVADQLIGTLKIALSHFEERGEDTSVYRQALTRMAEGISKNIPAQRMADVLGNGIKAQEAVPMAIYCFLANRASYEKALETAIFIGGDTDTIASMTGSISGAALGENSIPKRWLQRVREMVYTPEKLSQIAFELYRKGKMNNFKRS